MNINAIGVLVSALALLLLGLSAGPACMGDETSVEDQGAPESDEEETADQVQASALALNAKSAASSALDGYTPCSVSSDPLNVLWGKTVYFNPFTSNFILKSESPFSYGSSSVSVNCNNSIYVNPTFSRVATAAELDQYLTSSCVPGTMNYYSMYCQMNAASANKPLRQVLDHYECSYATSGTIILTKRNKYNTNTTDMSFIQTAAGSSASSQAIIACCLNALSSAHQMISAQITSLRSDPYFVDAWYQEYSSGNYEACQANAKAIYRTE